MHHVIDAHHQRPSLIHVFIIRVSCACKYVLYVRCKPNQSKPTPYHPFLGPTTGKPRVRLGLCCIIPDVVAPCSVLASSPFCLAFGLSGLNAGFDGIIGGTGRSPVTRRRIGGLEDAGGESGVMVISSWDEALPRS